MIKKSKNNENKPDFDVMFNEVQEEIQEKDAEQDIVDRVPQRMPNRTLLTGFLNSNS